MFKTTIVTLTPPERYFPRLPAPKSFIGQKIDEAVEALEEELWYTKRLLFENEDHGHFVEQVQTAVEARRVAESKVREKRAWIAANQYKIEAGTAALKRLEAQDEKMMEKDADLVQKDTAHAKLAAENAQLRGVVMDKTSAQVNLAADQVKLLAAQRKLTAENAQLRRNLVIVSGAFRKMLVGARRYGSGRANVVLGKPKGKALRKPSPSTKALCGVTKKRSRSARK